MAIAKQQISKAFRVLDLHGDIHEFEEIYTAFRRCVVEASDGHGGYNRDMDALTNAKEVLVKALQEEKAQQACTTAQQQTTEPPVQDVRTDDEKRRHADAIRRWARDAEEEEDRQRHERERRQRERQEQEAKKEAMRQQNLQTLRTWEREQAHKREQVRRLWSIQVSRQAQARLQVQQRERKQRMQQQREPGTQVQSAQMSDDPIQSSLVLLQTRRSELQQTRQHEDDLQEQLELTQKHRSQLEQTMQTADALAEQLIALLLASDSHEQYKK